MSHTPQDLVAKAKRAVPSISCEQLKTLKQSDQPYTLIDVREQDEWDAGHIEDAIHIPRGLIEFKISEAVPDKEATIVVVCKSGGRGALCGQSLQSLGYTNVKNLEGGYTQYCTEA